MTLEPGSVCVLVVDDDEIDRSAVERAVSRSGRGFSVQLTADGHEALAWLRALDPDRRSGGKLIILLDWKMPEMGGKAFLQAKQDDSELRRIPAVVLTTSNRREDVRDAYDLGAAGYFTKPVGYQELSKRLSSILDYWSCALLSA